MTNDDSYSDYARRETAREQLADQLRQRTKADLFHVLRSRDIAFVTVGFDGFGDSGQIEGVAALTADNKPVKLPAKRLTIKTANDDGTATKESTVTVRDVIETLCYELLAREHDGWEINEGAYGEFVFNVGRDAIELTFNSRFTDYETSTHTF
jgi:hypothetical protein